jgi:tellurite resistance protein
MDRSLRSRPAFGRLDADDAFIALLIGAMDASGHVSAEEAARAHNLIWSTRRFRRRDGDDVGRRIERTKTLIEQQGAARVIEAAARKIPPRLRPAAFAVAADLGLVDGRMERAEGRFLRQLASDLGLRSEGAKNVLAVLRIKNSASGRFFRHLADQVLQDDVSVTTRRPSAGAARRTDRPQPRCRRGEAAM